MRNNIGIFLRIFLFFGSLASLVLVVNWIDGLNFTKELFFKIIFVIFIIPLSIPVTVIAFRAALTYHPTRQYIQKGDFSPKKPIPLEVGEDRKSESYERLIEPLAKKKTETDEINGEEKIKLKKHLASKGNVFVFKEDLQLSERERKRRDDNNKFRAASLYPDDFEDVKQGIVTLYDCK